MFEAFMDFAIARIKALPDAHLFHYAAYEQTALKRLASLHGTRESRGEAKSGDRALTW
jgi:hypothetical protein